MKIHTLVGAEILERVRFPYPVVPIVRAHHEKWDGSGYPDALKGEAIPLGARIISVVDVFDALHTERPYKAAMPRSDAVSLLVRETDAGYWDPKIVDAFLDILRQYK
jgi:HD-GYP domain-containing protein (c-di-GMP phosphodiesterase class II)